MNLWIEWVVPLIWTKAGQSQIGLIPLQSTEGCLIKDGLSCDDSALLHRVFHPPVGLFSWWWQKSKTRSRNAQTLKKKKTIKTQTFFFRVLCSQQNLKESTEISRMSSAPHIYSLSAILIPTRVVHLLQLMNLRWHVIITQSPPLLPPNSWQPLIFLLSP